ncbi:MAG: hypothetical protein U0411_09855 [Thermodesulfovibrionales bacterium]
MTGWIEGTGTGYDYVTVAYDANGNELWTARYNGPRKWGGSCHCGDRFLEMSM